MMSRKRIDRLAEKKSGRLKHVACTAATALVVSALITAAHPGYSVPSDVVIQNPTPVSAEVNEDDGRLNAAATFTGDRVQNAIGHVVNILHEDWSDYFSYAYWREDGILELGFADAVPAAVVDWISALNIPFEIVEGVGATAYQIGLNTTMIAESLGEILPDNSTIIVAANTPAGRYEVTTSDLATVAGRREVEQFIAVDLHDFDLHFIHTQNEVHTANHGRAGGTWLRDHQGRNQCTSSFVVQNPNNLELGLLTAGHCPTPLRFIHQVTGAAVNLDTRTRVLDSRGDILFLRSPVMFDAWFHYRPFTGRPQEGIQVPFHGQNVCHFGMASNAMRCGVVEFPSTSIRVGSVTIGNQAQVRNTWVNRGDSSGPVYTGTLAVGTLTAGQFHANGTPVTNNGRIWLTRIDTALSLTGTRLCRNPVCS